MKVLISLSLLFCLISCTWWQAAQVTAEIIENVPPDSIIEEWIEDVIEDKTGVDLDLTPFSPEE